MSADRYSLFYCLQSNGWTSLKDEPEGLTLDWVRIYEVQVYQGSPFGAENREWKLRQENPTWPSSQADELENSFPRPAKNMELSQAALAFLERSGKH
jgi:hypothetical protein